MPVPPPDREMSRDQPPPIWRAASRATPRPCAVIISPTDAARGRYWVIGDVHEHAGPQPLCAAARSRLRSRCGRQMDRCRDRRAWRSARSDRAATAICPALARPWTRRAPFSPCRAPPPAPMLSHAASARAARPKPPAVCFTAGRPFPAPRPRPICAPAASPRRLDWPALRYHPSVYYRESDDAPLEVWPALLAAVTDLDGTITGIQRTWLDPHRPAKAPLADPRRALGHLLGNGVRFGKAADILAAGEGVETMLALKSVLPSLPMIAGLSANHLAALDLPPALRRLYVARDNDAAGHQGGRTGCANAARRRHRSPRARAGPWRLQPRSLPSRPRRHARASRGSARPVRPDALSARSSPLRSAAVSPASFGSPGVAPEGRTAFVCGGGVPSAGKEPRCGLPERRSAGGAGRQWRRPTIGRRRARSQWRGRDYFPPPPVSGAALHREAK